ncbi:MAG: nucleoside diphosphate kinase regulator [Chitinispirillaceae bacterium]|nr:nucleoside diphosphate kinase regulator [Chitinispirillaceae bacterium]
MSEKNIFITETDMKRLKELIRGSRSSGNNQGNNLNELEGELDRGVVVKPGEIPPDVVTMNSTVHLRDLETKEEITCRLVFPANADADQGCISILAPIGTALLGYRVGDTVEWKVPAGMTKLKIEKILYQPEAAGDYHL